MLRIFLPLCVLLQHGVSGDGSVEVSVKEGDSVTLHTSVIINQKDRIKWYFNDTRIAQIIGDLSFICADVQCNEGTERFRDRLKLDHQTGSLTITNTRNTDSGEYELQITSSSNNTDSLKIFTVTVSGASVSVKEGDSVTLHTDITTNQRDRIKWYFNDTRIAQINGDLSKTCTDVQCNEGNERFRDRLELDHQTGSLTIMNTRNTDSGVYHLEITSRNIEKIFNVTVYAAPGSGQSPAAPDPGLPPGAVAGIVVAVLLFLAAIGGVIYYLKHQARQKDIEMQASQDQANGTSPKQTDPLMEKTANGRSSNPTEAAKDTPL